MLSKVRSLIASRRFWVAVGGVVTVLLQDTIGIPEETANSVVAIGNAWIVGDSLRTTE